MKIRPYQDRDRQAVIDLWCYCGLVKPWNNPDTDIDRKLARDPEWFFVGEQSGEVIASVMVGYEGHRGWVNYLAVSPHHRRKGYGEVLMAHAERTLLAVNCPKINLQIRDTNKEAIGFYQSLGFDLDEAVSMGKRLIRDD